MPSGPGLGPALGVLAALAVPEAPAEGFRNPPAGAYGLGLAGGRIAHVDDASAAAHNPANLAELERPEAQIGMTGVHIRADYTAPSGQVAETTDPWKILPNVFAAWPLAEQKLTFGFGLTAPFGISNEWKREGAFGDPLGALRYTAPFRAELKTINANPTLAFRLGDRVRAGVGLDVMWSEIDLRQFYPWVLFPGGAGADPEGEARAEGRGFGLGANLGVTIDLAPRHRFAVTYRSPISIDYDGDFRISNVPARAGLFGASSRSDFATAIEFPAIAAIGYGFEISESIRLEASAEWIQFSNFQALGIDAGNNAFLLPSASIPQLWKDTFTLGIGADWRFGGPWSARLSYQHYQSPVPDATYSPTIPDANQNVVTCGIAYRGGRHTAELGYGAVFYEDREIQTSFNPAFNGRYEVMVHLFAFSYRYSF